MFICKEFISNFLVGFDNTVLRSYGNSDFNTYGSYYRTGLTLCRKWLSIALNFYGKYHKQTNKQGTCSVSVQSFDFACKMWECLFCLFWWGRSRRRTPCCCEHPSVTDTSQTSHSVYGHSLALPLPPPPLSFSFPYKLHSWITTPYKTEVSIYCNYYSCNVLKGWD